MDKVGFHYLGDTNRYSERDLAHWIPRLRGLEASWIVLSAPQERAIPESFISTLKAEGIEPVLHFQIFPRDLPAVDELLLLYENYRRWGVKYVVLYDRPNQRDSWQPEAWAQPNLPERFLDGFLPLAEAAVAAGLVPVFPPLEPGGDYWDCTFLRGALDGINRRASQPLKSRLTLSAYAGFNGRPLSWGEGGPQNWPESVPYLTPEGSEDQTGFRIAEWYLTLSETALEKRLPLLMLGIGGPVPEGKDPADILLNSARLIARHDLEDLAPLPEEVVGGAFLDLCGPEPGCWFQPDGAPNPVVVAFSHYHQAPVEDKAAAGAGLNHYLLLPSYDWGVADWHLNLVRPFIKRHQPAVGFSLEEASQARQVTVVGGEEHFSESDLSRLRNLGCQVRRVEGDGTKIASQLAGI